MDAVYRIGGYEVQTVRKLAEGGFGLVYLVQDLGPSRDGAQSTLCLKKCAINRQESYDTVKKEVNLLKRFAGPYVVQMLASEVNIRSGSDALLLLELCPNGHLLERLQSRNGELLPESVSHRIFAQILMGLKPMHESKPPVVHRDLKLENILIGRDNNVRICDFGSCYEGYVMLRDAGERSTAEEAISKETTQMYRAPEMIDLFMRPRLTEKADVWALGCIFYALCFLSHPFQDAGSLGILGAKIVMPPATAVSPESRTLITRMLDVSFIGACAVHHRRTLACLRFGNFLTIATPSFPPPLPHPTRHRWTPRLALQSPSYSPASRPSRAATPSLLTNPLQKSWPFGKSGKKQRREELPRMTTGTRRGRGRGVCSSTTT